MPRAWAFVIGLRPWLVGIVVWLVAASVTYAQNDRPPTAAVLGLLLTFLIGTAGLVRVLWPMRTYGNPPKLVAGAQSYDLHTYTGRVGSAAKTASTQFEAQSSVSQNVMTGDLFHQMSTTQRTTVQDDVTLVGADGTQHNVQVRDVNLAVGTGQLVSAAWAIRPGRRNGPYVLFRNHTTGTDAYPRPRLWWLATGRGAIGYLLCMWLGALLLAFGGHVGMGVLWFVVVPFVYIGLGYYRAARFRSGSGALATFLDGVAATFGPGSDAAASSTTAAPGGAAGPAAAAQAVRVPSPPVAVPPPPAWLADPTGRHAHRFWDGRVWTDQVADAGVAASDPL